MTPVKHRVTTRVTASGRVSMTIRTPEGWEASSEFPTRAEAFERIEWLRGHLNSDAPDQRGPAADKRVPV